MKLWAMAGVLTVVAIPFAGAAEASAECQVEEGRRFPQVRIDNGAPGGSAPQAARQTSAPRELADDNQVADQEPPAPRQAAADRRRNGKRIPDAELIAPRGAL